VEQRFQDFDLSPKMVDVIKIFLEDPSKPRYGMELMRATKQPSGTLYPILAKFEKNGWLSLGNEDIDPRVEGRPARRFYRITGAAEKAAHRQLAALSARYRPPAGIRPRLITDGGAL
jgi:DNA-binding PadR family transcriptional regulator